VGSGRPEPSPLPPLVLAASDPPQLIYERAHEPSDDSPILYRERAFAVDSLLTDEELEAHLQGELSNLRDSFRGREVPQFIQLASFDHSFDEAPSAPPLATLSWKDWQGRTEVWVRGIQRAGSTTSTPPAAALPADRASEAEPESAPQSASVRTTSSSLPAEDEDSLPSEDEWGRADDVLSSPPPSSAIATHAGAERAGDSGAAWSSPSQSGHYPVAQIEEASVPPPSSERVLASEELIGALFERMHELLYLPSISAGADYILDTIFELIPCDAAVVHVFDLDARDFVVVRARGPRSDELVLRRTPSVGSRLEEALRRQATLRQGPIEVGQDGGLWQALGASVERALCSPVHQSGRYLGAIELGLAAGKGTFSDAHVNAVEYICEQFADFVADRPIVLDAKSIRPPAQ
jgi:hypothetical protein